MYCPISSHDMVKLNSKDPVSFAMNTAWPVCLFTNVVKGAGLPSTFNFIVNVSFALNVSLFIVTLSILAGSELKESRIFLL